MYTFKEITNYSKGVLIFLIQYLPVRLNFYHGFNGCFNFFIQNCLFMSSAHFLIGVLSSYYWFLIKVLYIYWGYLVKCCKYFLIPVCHLLFWFCFYFLCSQIFPLFSPLWFMSPYHVSKFPQTYKRCSTSLLGENHTL